MKEENSSDLCPVMCQQVPLSFPFYLSRSFSNNRLRSCWLLQ